MRKEEGEEKEEEEERWGRSRSRDCFVASADRPQSAPGLTAKPQPLGAAKAAAAPVAPSLTGALWALRAPHAATLGAAAPKAAGPRVVPPRPRLAATAPARAAAPTAPAAPRVVPPRAAGAPAGAAALVAVAPRVVLPRAAAAPTRAALPAEALAPRAARRRHWQWQRWRAARKLQRAAGTKTDFPGEEEWEGGGGRVNAKPQG